MADLQMLNFPKIPDNTFSGPVEGSEDLVRSNSNTKLNLFWDFDHGDGNGWVADPDTLPHPVPGVWQSDQVNYYGSRPNYTLTLQRHWWRRDYRVLREQQRFLGELPIDYGISQTEMQTFSSELGVDVEGISAKATELFSVPIRVAESATATAFIDVSNQTGDRTVVALWQLVDRVACLNGRGDSVSWPRGDFGCYIHDWKANGALMLLSGSHEIFTDFLYTNLTIFDATTKELKHNELQAATTKCP
ncbi:MAG: hypothetical protein QOI38_54 [Sphingomonadales bacterium]|jgi:hypothetical protein|nr:hypothetical protein [Sphingomonadales bacterium]